MRGDDDVGRVDDGAIADNDVIRRGPDRRDMCELLLQELAHELDPPHLDVELVGQLRVVQQLQLELVGRRRSQLRRWLQRQLVVEFERAGSR